MDIANLEHVISLDELQSMPDWGEDRINKLKYRSLEIIKIETQRKKMN